MGDVPSDSPKTRVSDEAAKQARKPKKPKGAKANAEAFLRQQRKEIGEAVYSLDANSFSQLSAKDQQDWKKAVRDVVNLNVELANLVGDRKDKDQFRPEKLTIGKLMAGQIKHTPIIKEFVDDVIREYESQVAANRFPGRRQTPPPPSAAEAAAAAAAEVAAVPRVKKERISPADARRNIYADMPELEEVEEVEFGALPPEEQAQRRLAARVREKMRAARIARRDAERQAERRQSASAERERKRRALLSDERRRASEERARKLSDERRRASEERARKLRESIERAQRAKKAERDAAQKQREQEEAMAVMLAAAPPPLLVSRAASRSSQRRSRSSSSRAASDEVKKVVSRSKRAEVDIPRVDIPLPPADPSFDEIALESAAAGEYEEAEASDQSSGQILETELVERLLNPNTVKKMNVNLLRLLEDKEKRYRALLADEKKRLQTMRGGADGGAAKQPAGTAPDATGAQTAVKQAELVNQLEKIHTAIVGKIASVANDAASGDGDLLRRLRNALTDPDAAGSGRTPRGIFSLTGTARAPIRRKLILLLLSLARSPINFEGASAWVLVGPAGTGKSAVAEVIGHVFGTVGVLVNGTTLNVRYSDIISSAVGKTTENMRSILNRSLENVLFLDEAYRLAKHCATMVGGRPAAAEGHDFGLEASNELLQFLEGPYRGLFTLIVAGYEDNMECWLDTNEGLRRRFSDRERLLPLTVADLTQIFVNRANALLTKSGAKTMLNDEERDWMYTQLKQVFDPQGMLGDQAGDMVILSEKFGRAITQVLDAEDEWNDKPGRGVDRGNLRLLGQALADFAAKKGNPIKVRVPCRRSGCRDKRRRGGQRSTPLVALELLSGLEAASAAGATQHVPLPPPAEPARAAGGRRLGRFAPRIRR